MRRTKLLLILGAGCTGLVLVLLLTVILTTRLLSNREMVKSFIVAKADQATGAELEYDRLDVRFFPLPHLSAHEVHLHRPGVLTVTARELAIYPRLRPILAGRIRFDRLILVAPDFQIRLNPESGQVPTVSSENGLETLGDRFRRALDGLFQILASIDQGAALQIEKGAISIDVADGPDFHLTALEALAEKVDGRLSLDLQGRSETIGDLTLSAHVDAKTSQAGGRVSLVGLNLRPLLSIAPLPGGVAIGDTRAEIQIDFSVDGLEQMQSRFNLQAPSLTILRNGRSLRLEGVAVPGTLAWEHGSLLLSVDAFDTQQPPLKLSASATLGPVGSTGRADLKVHAAAKALDVEAAGDTARAIAGDLESIQTAFDVTKAGRLTDVTCSADLDAGRAGWRMKTIKASGRLRQGRVTIPGIAADLENMDAQIDFTGKRVVFNDVGGFFKGVTFSGLEAVIDWENSFSTLSLSGRTAAVDAAPLYAWLTTFDALNEAMNDIDSISGSASVSTLNIHGPMTEPAEWDIDVSATPDKIRLTSPRVPFDVTLSDGVVRYRNGHEQWSEVTVGFLDGSLVSSYQSGSDTGAGSPRWSIDGSMGQNALDWLGTILPIPDHLQIKPPVSLSDVSIVWDGVDAFSFAGGLKTAGGVDLYADLARDPGKWQIRSLRFSDGYSKATLSARKADSKIELAFAGNIERQTADRLLRDNRTLSGRLEGDFRARLDTRKPLNTSLDGSVAGEGLHLQTLFPEPVELSRFSLHGSGSQLKIADSVAVLGGSRLAVKGELTRDGSGLTVDLDVDADHVDEKLIRAFEPGGQESEDAAALPSTSPGDAIRGTVHLQAADLTYGGFTWRPVLADIRIDGDRTGVAVHRASLCGISTTGRLEFSPAGMSLDIIPSASGASLQETTACLWNRPVKADSRFDLNGEIHLPPSRQAPMKMMSGEVEFSSTEGRVDYAPLLMDILALLNITELFTGGRSDLTEKGFGYTRAYVRGEIDDGELRLAEILLDGHSLKLTGQGRVALDTFEADITLLAAPLKTIDRIINNVPIINYIAGGSLISIPLRIRGPVDDMKVTPLPAAAVGKGVVHLMERTLKAPFKLVQSAVELAPDTSSEMSPPTSDSNQKGP